MSGPTVFPPNAIQVPSAGLVGKSAAGGCTTITVGSGLTLSGTTLSSSVDLSGYATTAAVAAGYQPLDSDLTAIAALSTTTFGRSLLTQADAASTLSTIGAASSSHTHATSEVTGLDAALASKAADSAVIHTTGNETKTGNITLTGSLIFDSTYEDVTAGMGGSNAHVGMTYRGVVKAGAFGSSANGFGAGQVALGTITGTSISPQAYLLPNTDGVKVTQSDRSTNGTLLAGNIDTSGSIGFVGNQYRIVSSVNRIWFQPAGSAVGSSFITTGGIWMEGSQYFGISPSQFTNNPDVQLGRNATGPKWQMRADGGVEVKNLAGNADAPISGSQFTPSSSSAGMAFRVIGGVNSPIFNLSIGTAAYEFAVVAAGNASGWMQATSGGGFSWSSSNQGSATDLFLRRVSSGVLAIGTGATNSLGGLQAGAATFSGDVNVAYAKRINFVSGGSVGNSGGAANRVELFGTQITLGTGVNGGACNVVLGDYASTSLNITGTNDTTATMTINAGDLANPGVGSLLVLRGGNGMGANSGGNVRVHGGAFGTSGSDGNVIIGHTGSAARGRVLVGTSTDDGSNTLQVNGPATFSGTVKLGSFTAATLPLASANARATAFVTDSSATYSSANIGSTVTGGGSNLVPVWSNGTNWVIG